MGNDFTAALRVQVDLTNRQGAAKLDELAHADDTCRCRWLAQEVDIQAGGHRQRDDADLPEDGNIERNISSGHENGPRYRASGPQLGWANLVRDGRASVAYFEDSALRLREFACDERGDFFLGGHDLRLCET